MTSLFSKKVIKETLFQFYLYDTTDQLMLQPAVTIVSLFLLFVSQRICKDHVGTNILTRHYRGQVRTYNSRVLSSIAETRSSEEGKAPSS